MSLSVIDVLVGQLAAFVENVGKLAAVVENVVSLISEDDDEVQKIKDELDTLKSFLNDAENRGGHSKVEKTWIAQVRDVTIEIEDAIAAGSYNENKKQSQNQFNRFVCHPKHLWERRQFAKELQKLSNKVKEILERKHRYVVDHLEGKAITPHVGVEYHRQSSRFLRNDNLVGIENAKGKLLGWLMSEEKEQIVVSVVGMAGSGKTTLVANILESNAVKQHFDCYAFVTVSQTYRVEDLLTTMVKDFYKTKRKRTLDLSNVNYTDLVNIVESILDSKRYLIVLDDVWDTNLWKIINVALPDGQCGSRVMLTTRNEGVAHFLFGVRSHVHNLLPLEESDSWDLFCMKAFPNKPTKQCPIELTSIAKDFVRKCRGLPLGIATLGALLSTKELESEWRRVYNDLSSELSNNPMVENVKSILLLGFQDLSRHLKHCFLCCCLFPEDDIMKRPELINLWIAEGLVQQDKKKTLLEMADSYLLELTCRSMLQVFKRDPNGKPIEFKMHDLLRELAISIAETEKFCTVITGKEANMEIETRRLSIQGNNVQLGSYKGLSKVRTLFVRFPSIVPSSLSAVLSSLKMVTVLNLKGAPIVELPHEISNFFNLTYLNLAETNVEKLPKSIGNLCNLQTLDIEGSKIKTLPNEISNLKRLRTLNAWLAGDHGLYTYNVGVSAPLNICEMKNLDHLGVIEVEDDLIKRLRYMTQLRSLHVAKVKLEYEKDLCVSIEGMKLLQTLVMHAADHNEVLCMDAMSSIPPSLYALRLSGKLEKVPHWFHSLQSITVLRLYDSRLKEDFLPYIQTLPNLRQLRLRNTYTGNQLCFTLGFQKLSLLSISRFPKLNEIIIEKGVMPCVDELRIKDCKELNALPHGSEHLSTLQVLTLRNMSADFIERIRGEASVDRHKIQHIPEIIHWIGIKPKCTYEDLS